MSSTTVELVTDRAPSVDLTVYRKEIYNFLKTVTIKYKPLETALNEYVLYKGGTVNESDPSSWKYYLNAVGKYHPIDTEMYIMSLDTKEKILFSRENLTKSPRTLEAYSVGNDYYTELCDVYPSQLDLIKNIRYPVSDWQTLYDADNLTYITGDTSILEENERDSLLAMIDKTLTFVSSRWDFPGTDVEPLYPWVFYGYIWQILATALFAQRFENIQTSEAHSWHVWQYITSNGLSDYSDLLTFSQAMFLYRNLEYLIANRGKQSNLLILADNLLQEWSLSLYGRHVIQRTDKGKDDCLLYPDLVAKVIPTANASSVPIPLTSVEDTIYKLIATGCEIPADEYPPAENAARQERVLSDTEVNTYPTKVVELSPVDRNKKYSQEFDSYIYDSLVYGVTSGSYSPIVEIPSKINSKVIQVSAKDCLLLFNYCMYKSVGDTPETIPVNFVSARALKQGPITLREWYGTGVDKVNINALVNVYDYTNGNFQMDYNQSIPTDFSQELLKGFETLSHQIEMQRLCSESRTGRIMRFISKNMMIIGNVPLNLTTATTYNDWLSENPEILTHLIAPIDSSKNSEDAYSDLATGIIDTLVPVLPGFNYYGDYTLTSSAYKRVIQLFTQMTSYNITFVDDNTTSPTYFFTPHQATTISDSQYTGEELYWEKELTTKIAVKMTDKLHACNIDRLAELGDIVSENMLTIETPTNVIATVYSGKRGQDMLVDDFTINTSLIDKGRSDTLKTDMSAYTTTITLPDVVYP